MSLMEGQEHTVVRAWGSCHIVSMVRKQREIKAGTQLPFSFSFTPGLQSVGCLHPHLREVSLPQLNLSGNALTDMARDISPRWFWIQPTWPHRLNITGAADIEATLKSKIWKLNYCRSFLKYIHTHIWKYFKWSCPIFKGHAPTRHQIANKISPCPGMSYPFLSYLLVRSHRPPQT